MEMTKEDIDKLKIAMLLYDIGKLMIPEEILNKKEPLTEEEKETDKRASVNCGKENIKTHKHNSRYSSYN